MDGERWIGNAVAYGPHRDGQRPGGVDPTPAELLQDLRLMAPRWGLLRVYASTGATPALLGVIREEGIPMKVMLGVWIDPERTSGEGATAVPDTAAMAANRREVESAVRLAAEYPDLVPAVCVGNETQIFWSAHRVKPEVLIGYLREIRARVAQPVTTADDFNFWNKPESGAVADEVDFIVMHAHPLWNGILLPDALAWTADRVAEIRNAHPGMMVVLGETGWATRRYTEGDQAKLMKGRLGEPEQAQFYREIRAWAEAQRTTVFFFEAFDENWKGGDHPDEVEKHWGLFRADRTPKEALSTP